METVLNAFLAYLVLVDPIGTSLLFNALTDGRPEAWSRKMALRAVGLSTTLVLFFGFWGNDLLLSLGIQTESFKVAGGLLIFYAAFGMITRPESRSIDPQLEALEDISVYPLSIPFIAGPGCLTLTVLLFSQARERSESVLPLIVAILLVYALTLASFLGSKVLARVVGRTLNNIFRRLLGVLLASLAVQFVAEGVRTLMG